MFSQIRWRIAIPYVLLITLVTAALILYLTWSGCASNTACLRRAMGGAAVVMSVAAVLLALVIAERTARPIRQLTEVARRITTGDVNVRILPQGRDEVGELTRTFSQMTEQMGARLTALAEERQQLATVVTYMADGVLITDELGYVRLINPAAERLLKTKEKSALGHSFAEVVRHHQLIELWQRCQTQGEEQIEAIEVGRGLFLQAVVTPFQEKGAHGFLIILQDLTQVRRLQTMRRDFISNISHELRTPLASLRAVVETLQDGALADPPAAQRFLDRAGREVDTLTQMVEELLELSRIESGQAPLRLAPTAVADLVLIPLERLRSQAERSELSIVLELPARLPRIVADEDRMQQVVTNLLHNAIKFTLPGGKITIRAYTDEKKQPPEVIVAVSDTGIGIPSEDLPRIFERFYKSDRARTRSRGGTGLGLAIARHIVQAHNGRIWAESKEGQGSAFYFSLPTAI
jgi:two-component system phosphate regulon sensor histidine kinase PhoR